MKAERVLHLQIEIVVGSLEIVAQMQNPYNFCFFLSILLLHSISKKFDRLTANREDKEGLRKRRRAKG
jgi:hypothetical protein